MRYIFDRIDPNERFRDRRRRDRRRRRLRRAAAAAVVLALVAGLAIGATFFPRRGGARQPAAAPKEKPSAPPPAAPARPPELPRAPAEIRGIHVTMGLASVRGKLDQYIALRGYGL